MEAALDFQKNKKYGLDLLRKNREKNMTYMKKKV